MFKNLRNISCKKHLRTFRKGNKVIQYLPWEVCWDKLKEIYPSAKSEWVMYEYDSKPFGGVMSPDGSVIVHCRITIDFKGKEITHNEYLHKDHLCIFDNIYLAHFCLRFQVI